MKNKDLQSRKRFTKETKQVKEEVLPAVITNDEKPRGYNPFYSSHRQKKHISSKDAAIYRGYVINNLQKDIYDNYHTLSARMFEAAYAGDIKVCACIKNILDYIVPKQKEVNFADQEVTENMNSQQISQAVKLLLEEAKPMLEQMKIEREKEKND